MPLNFHIGKTEIPLGLMMITVALFALAIINVLTKKVATISGVTFTIAFFIVFELSDSYNRKRTAGALGRRWRSSGWTRATTSPPTAVNVRPGNVLVAVRNPNRLQHLAAHPGQDRHAQDGYRGALGAAGHAGRLGRARSR